MLGFYLATAVNAPAVEQIRCLESALAIERRMPKAPPAAKSALIPKTAGVAAAKLQAGGAAGAVSPKAVGGASAARKQARAAVAFYLPNHL